MTLMHWVVMMDYCNVTTSYSGNKAKYTVSLEDASGTYRGRLFFDYSGVSSFVKTGYGLHCLVDGTEYDDWSSSFRPARVDSIYDSTYGHTKNFNTEIRVPLSSDGDTDLEFIGKDDGVDVPLVLQNGSNTYNFGGASVLAAGSYVSPAGFLVEKLESSVAIAKVTYQAGIVTVKTLTPHPFVDGDAITITGIPNASDTFSTNNHMMGKNGERYMGTFKITRIDEKTFSYATIHYVSKVSNHSGLSNTGRAEKWVVCEYSMEGTIYNSAANDTVVAVTIPDNTFVPGDYVSLVSDTIVLPNVEVIEVSDDDVTISCGSLPRKIDGTYEVRYCPRVPSASIAVNYPYDADIDEVVRNIPKYAHTVNTYMTYPIVDTYFDKTDGSNNDKSTELVTSANSIVFLKFTSGFNASSVDGSAELTLYVKSDDISRCSLVLYQVNSNQWTPNMTYDNVMSMTGATVISQIDALDNPSLSEEPLGYIKFVIPSNIVSKWLSGASGYPASVAVQVKTSTSGAVVFNSVESMEFKPYLTLSGGEKAAVEPDLIIVEPAVEHAMPGTTIRIQVTGDGTFGEYTYNNMVEFTKTRGNHVETYHGNIIAGTELYLDVKVPDNLNGNYDVIVYSKQVDGSMLMLTEPFQFYVDGDPQLRNKKLGEKIDPGDIAPEDLSRAAIYNRDLSFSNFSEVTDGNSLIQNLYNILLTRKGERMFNPDFGTTIEERIFELSEMDDEIGILQECISAISTYEPRVKVNAGLSSVTAIDNNGLRVDLAVILPGDIHEELHLTFKSRGVEI